MALINTADPLWPRVSAAFNAVQGPPPPGVTADDFAYARIMQFIKQVVRNNEAAVQLQPSAVTVQAAVTKIDADFAAQVPVSVQGLV
jgi:hypothetical protein